MCFRICKLFDNKKWWLAGGIPASACVAAYQPKGASGLAESYTNLANPGVYNCTAPTAAPTWDVVNGWKFNGTTQYLDSGVIPPINQTWSGIVRWSNIATNSAFLTIFGAESATNTGFIIAFRTLDTPDRYYYYNGGLLNAGLLRTVALGVSAVSGNRGFFNGVAETGVIPTTAAVNTSSIFIGCLNSSGSPYIEGTQYIQAVAFFSTVLTDYQIAELTRAMNAL